MVLSTTKRTSSIDSIINQNQGGGDKKAGLPGTTGRDYHFPISLKTHPTRNTLYNYGSPVVFGLRHTRNPNVSISRPIGSTLTPNPYWNFIGAV